MPRRRVSPTCRSGAPARVVGVRMAGASREARELALRLLEIGFMEGEPVRVIAQGHPGREPIAVRVGGTTFALRRFEAEQVLVALDARTRTRSESMSASIALRVALLGNPNCGKTALFNLLTGSRQKVANFAGVTVERKEGRLRMPDGRSVTVLDLPGAYSLNPTSADEAITRDVVLGALAGEAAPDLVVCVDRRDQSAAQPAHGARGAALRRADGAGPQHGGRGAPARHRDRHRGARARARRAGGGDRRRAPRRRRRA